MEEISPFCTGTYAIYNANAPSHPKNTPSRTPSIVKPSAAVYTVRTPQRSPQPLRQHRSGVRRWDDAVVPEAGGGEGGLALALDARLQRGVGCLADCGHDGAELLGAHDADARRGPHP